MMPNTQQIFENFTKSTISTLKSLCKTDAVPLSPYAKSAEKKFQFEVAGIIGVTSETARGAIGVYFPKEVFLELLSRMFDEKVEVVDRRNEDAAAEVMNIIFGMAKVTLNELGHNFQVSIPSVFRGGNVQASSSSQHEVIVYPFQVDKGEFYLEFTLIPLKDSEKVGIAAAREFGSAFKAAFFKPFIDATVHSIATMCSIQSNPGTPSSKKNSDAVAFDLAGVIGITSSVLTGSYMVCFKNDVFLKLMSKLLGEEFTTVAPGMEDGVAELLNIILGQAKMVLNDKHGYAIQMALPTLVYGDRVRTSLQAGKTTIVIPFYSDIGRFVVEVTID